MKNFKRKEVKGFTIIELVVVIAVIAILAAVLIPTFSNLVKKANMSADMQVVKNMNTALTTDEIINGKPSTVVEAQEVLIANGISNFKTHDNNNQYYWLGSDNRIILWDKVELEVTYPEEYKKLFKGINEVSNSWSLLDEDYDVIVVTPEEGQSIRSALLASVQSAEDGAIIKLPEDSVVDMGEKGLSFLGSYMKNDGGTGKNLTIDLNGGKLESLTPYSDGRYYGTTIPAGGSLTLINGEIEAAGYINGFNVLSGAHLIMRNVEMTVAEGDAIFPSGDASEVVLENCKIIAGANYGIATNNRMSDNIYIKITSTEIQAGSCGLLVNVPCDVLIEDSTITGGGWGVFIRSGHAEIINSTIKTTDGDVGANDSRYNTSCEYFAYNGSDADIPYWGQGAQVPYAPLIVGDYASHNAYNHDTSCTLTNVKIENINPEKIPDIVVAARPEGKDVVINYDNDTNVGKVVIYGEGYVRDKFVGLDGKTYGINHTFAHNGTITINGTAKTYTGTVVSPIVSKTFDNRYTIPEAVGTFEAYKSHSISVLNVEVDGVNILEEFKAFYAEQGFVLTDAQWATATFAAGSTANKIKTITYDSSAE